MPSNVQTYIQDWSNQKEHEKNDNFNALKNEYLNGDENLQDKILNDLAVLGKGIKFDIFLGDTSGSLGLTEFNELMEALSPQKKAEELGLHEINSIFRESLSKYSGLTARNSVSVWIKSAPLGRVFQMTSVAPIEIDDSGIKSLFLAVGMLYPTLLHTLMFRSHTFNDDSFMSRDEIDMLKRDYISSIRNSKTTNADVMNMVASALVLYSHKLLDGYRDIESNSMFEDSRFYTLDMVLSMFEIGVMIGDVVVGDRENISSGRITHNNRLQWEVSLPHLVEPRKDSRLAFYENISIGPYFREYAYNGEHRPLMIVSRKFWERVLMSNQGIGSDAVGLVMRIINRIVT
jgi:hypothetical protein